MSGMKELVERLSDEADLCRSEGAHDIAALEPVAHRVRCGGANKLAL